VTLTCIKASMTSVMVTTLTKDRTTMYIYVIDILSKVDAHLTHNAETIGEALSWIGDQAIVEDFVTVSEGYVAADGGLEINDLLDCWWVE